MIRFGGREETRISVDETWIYRSIIFRLKWGFLH